MLILAEHPYSFVPTTILVLIGLSFIIYCGKFNLDKTKKFNAQMAWAGLGVIYTAINGFDLCFLTGFFFFIFGFAHIPTKISWVLAGILVLFGWKTLTAIYGY